jgi:hypothetical protein
MRKHNRLILFILGLLVCSIPTFLGCSKKSLTNPGPHEVTYSYTIYTPVLQLKQLALDSLNGDPAKSIDSVGKIYIKGNYIFLNDVDKGIHVIDNSDPSRPKQTAFLRIPGNQDIAIEGNTLFADMYSDLLAIDISDLHQVRLSSRLPGLFSDRQFENGYVMDSNHIIVDWIMKDTTVTYMQYGFTAGGGPISMPDLFAASNVPSASNSSAVTGTAASSAKMVLINQYLYAITEMHHLGAIDIHDPQAPVQVFDQFAGYDLETIFPFQDKLFLGSDIGTFIYDLSNPAIPSESGEFTHGTACDPVITDGSFAYVTLHAGTYCGGSSNELDVVKVENLEAPTLVRSYRMISPHGLTKDGNILFVCDGASYVKVYDATNPASLRLLTLIRNTGPFDVIAANNILMVVATGGLYQYDYSDIGHIKALSFFATK